MVTTGDSPFEETPIYITFLILLGVWTKPPRDSENWIELDFTFGG